MIFTARRTEYDEGYVFSLSVNRGLPPPGQGPERGGPWSRSGGASLGQGSSQGLGAPQVKVWWGPPWSRSRGPRGQGLGGPLVKVQVKVRVPQSRSRSWSGGPPGQGLGPPRSRSGGPQGQGLGQGLRGPGQGPGQYSW